MKKIHYTKTIIGLHKFVNCYMSTKKEIKIYEKYTKMNFVLDKLCIKTYNKLKTAQEKRLRQYR